MAAFKFLPARQATGRVGAYVAVDSYFAPDALHKNNNDILLTVEAVTAKKFERFVDELIKELEELKLIARRRFASNPVSR